MDTPAPQQEQSLNPKDYKNIVIVAGTRGFNDLKKFHAVLVAYLERFEGPVLFVSGAAASGADRLIIQWCDKFRYPCLLMPAEWETRDSEGNLVKNRGAGFARNAKMADVGTHLLCFFDGASPGSAHMIDVAMRKALAVKIVNITVETP